MFPPKIWRDFPQRYRLEAGKCENEKCKKITFPKRQICPGCGGRKITTIQLPRIGHVVQFTIVHNPPPAFQHQSPYIVGIIDLGKNVLITCQICDCSVDQISLGLKVILEFRAIQKDKGNGVIAYGYKATPAGEHNCV